MVRGSSAQQFRNSSAEIGFKKFTNSGGAGIFFFFSLCICICIFIYVYSSFHPREMVLLHKTALKAVSLQLTMSEVFYKADVSKILPSFSLVEKILLNNLGCNDKNQMKVSPSHKKSQTTTSATHKRKCWNAFEPCATFWWFLLRVILDISPVLSAAINKNPPLKVTRCQLYFQLRLSVD